MVPSSFIWIPELFISQGPTPAVWPKGGTRSSVGKPCVSGASWPALLKVASVLSHEAGRGVSGFGSFCRNKRASAAGPNPGNTENHGDRRVEPTRATHLPTNACYLENYKIGSRHTSYCCKASPCRSGQLTGGQTTAGAIRRRRTTSETY